MLRVTNTRRRCRSSIDDDEHVRCGRKLVSSPDLYSCGERPEPIGWEILKSSHNIRVETGTGLPQEGLVRIALRLLYPLRQDFGIRVAYSGAFESLNNRSFRLLRFTQIIHTKYLDTLMLL